MDNNSSEMTNESSIFFSTISPTNTTTQSLDLRSQDHISDYILFFMYIITAIFALIGNAFVCWVIKKSSKLRSTTYYLLFNMALSDFLAGLVIPGQWITCHHKLYITYENFIPRICNVIKALQIFSYYISTYSMLFIAIDRYMLLCYPNSGGLHRKWIPLSLSWIVAIIFSSSTLIHMRNPVYFMPNALISCRLVFKLENGHLFRKVRIAAVLFGQFIIPSIATGILYYFVWVAIKSREVVGSKSENNMKRYSSGKKKLIKMLVIVVAGFTLAWFPLHLIHFINFFVVPIVPKACNASPIYNFFYWLAISSCCYNPFIYYWGNEDIRSEFLAIWAKMTGNINILIKSLIISILITKYNNFYRTRRYGEKKN